jgi:hypothetical protein
MIFVGKQGANYAVKNSLPLPCLGMKAGVAIAMNTAVRSEMTAATPAAGRRMLADAYLQSGK